MTGWLAACALACVAGCGGEAGTAGSPASGAQQPPSGGTEQAPTGATCTPGEACASTSGPCVVARVACAGGSAVCTDAGVAPDGSACGAGQVCASGQCVTQQPAPVVGACTNPVATSAAPAGDGVQSLGVRRVGSTVRFTVPANTIGLTIVEQATSAPATVTYGGQALDNTAVPLRLVAPGGVVVHDDLTSYAALSADAITALPAYYASAAPGTGTMTVPNSTGGLALLGPTGLPAGTWTLTVSDYAYECTLAGFHGCTGGTTASTYDVTVITKPGTGGAIPAQGAIDVAVYLATTDAGGGAPLSAATANAGGDPDLNRMVQSLRTYLGRGGITLSSVTYRDLPAAALAAYATGVPVDDTGVCSALASLLRQSAPGNLLDVFLVSKLLATSDQTAVQVVGVDGTIPGPATFGGTGASGAAVSTEDLRYNGGTRSCSGATPNLLCGADSTAYVIAHEAGHFMGLYHVTESEGFQFDPLQDTPMCPCSSCAPSASRTSCATATSTPASPYQMQVADCAVSTSCGGGGNLMFWLLDRGSTGTLTTDQQRVLRASPLVH